MVFEEITLFEWVKKRNIFFIITGILYFFISYFTGLLFFEKNFSIVILFLTTLLLIPTVMRMINKEEEIERKEGLKHFLRNHKSIIESYLSVFLGLFIGSLLIGFIVPETNFDSAFGYQLDFLEKNKLSKESMQEFLQAEENFGTERFMVIVQNNLTVVLISFILSFLYGAGAIFLIVFNASIFSTTIILISRYIAETISQTFLIIGLFSIHLIPEVAGFLLAAMAGGIISRAFLKEKFMSENFKNVIRDSTILLVISIVLIIGGALLESYVTTGLFLRFF